MLFRLKRKVRCEGLSIKITFEQSGEIPCEMMQDHANEVEASVLSAYDDTEKPPELIAFEIVDKFRRVSSVEVTDDETGDSVVCEHECECGE